MNEQANTPNDISSILLVCARPLLSEALVPLLQASIAMPVQVIASMAAIEALPGRDAICLFIVDAGLSVSTIRDNYPGVPVLILREPATTTDESACERAETIDLPVRFSSLVTRVRACLSAATATVADELRDPATDVRMGPWWVHPVGRRAVHDNGAAVWLTEKEVAVLLFLMDKQDNSVPREVLLREVWDYHAEATTHTVETHIYRLRQKLDKAVQGSAFLVTDAGGYRLVL